METLAPTEFASPETEPELHLLLARDRSGDWRRWRKAAIVSVAVHVVLLIVLLVLMPESESRVYEQPPPDIPCYSALHTHPADTESAEQGQAQQGIDGGGDSGPCPLIKSPTPAPAVKQAPAPPPPAPQIAQRRAKTRDRRATEDRAAKDAGGQPLTDQLAKLNPPLPPPTQQPKMVFENAARLRRRPQVPIRASPSAELRFRNLSIEATIHDLATNGAAGGHQSVGDTGADPGTCGPGLNLPPSARDARIRTSSS